MGNWILKRVEDIITIQNTEGIEDRTEKLGSAYYQLATEIVLVKVSNYDGNGDHSIACLTNTLDNAHSVEELSVLARLYASAPICGLLDDPYADNLFKNEQMVKGIVGVMQKHGDSERLRIFAEILGRFCRDWYVGDSEETAMRIRSVIRTVCLECPDIEEEMATILEHLRWRTVRKERPLLLAPPKISFLQWVFGR